MKVVLFGAGRSSFYLIDYLGKYLTEKGGTLIIADINTTPKNNEWEQHRAIKQELVNASDSIAVSNTVKGANLVVSLLPASLHESVADICLEQKIHLATASYVSKEMQKLHTKAVKKNLVFLNECGLDPGLDHMSAMQVIDKIKEQNNTLLEFESYCGGLPAPESEENPWKYKFSWNPRNVVLAGKAGTASFLHHGQIKYIPYHKLFERTDFIDIDGAGSFEGYANRNSLQYIDLYNIEGIKTLYRGTLRRPGFCKAWNLLVQAGMTDDSYEIEGLHSLTYAKFTNSFLPYSKDATENKFKKYLNADTASINMLRWLGLFDHEKINLQKGSPADVLQHLLTQKWAMKTNDKDLAVMLHKFVYQTNNHIKTKYCSLVVKGTDNVRTAMAKTVGLPLAISCKLILENKIKSKGVVLPITKEFYAPVLKELSKFQIVFHEKEF